MRPQGTSGVASHPRVGTSLFRLRLASLRRKQDHERDLRSGCHELRQAKSFPSTGSLGSAKRGVWHRYRSTSLVFSSRRKASRPRLKSSFEPTASAPRASALSRISGLRS